MVLVVCGSRVEPNKSVIDALGKYFQDGHKCLVYPLGTDDFQQ